MADEREPRPDDPELDEPSPEGSDGDEASGEGEPAPPPPAPPTAPPEPSPVDEGPAAWPTEKERYGYIWGTGRRKTAVARVRLRRGAGTFLVNDRPYEQYFTSERERVVATAALRSTKRLGHYDIFVRTEGGGPTGQAGAVLLGTARALKLAEPRLEPVLRENGHLTRDSRQKERKKYGQRGARRSFQFSKR